MLQLDVCQFRTLTGYSTLGFSPTQLITSEYIVIEVIHVLVEGEHPAACGEEGLNVDEVGGPGGEELRADAQNVHAVEEYDDYVERGDEPECCDAEEEGCTDAVEEFVDLVKQLREVVGVEDLAELLGEGGTILVLRDQGRCVPEREAVTVQGRHRSPALDYGGASAAGGR
ncbi:C6 zinc finger domain-containing protein, putative [Babesia ovata]|uniref:C6 zinc finger domain-containing protein, putative n=1 Tax=Babesia ovata TaxID=189622 RepID=A0A2H6K6V4_9APIC|nr:C6 zinc finger domain-containing protein, putative [Babesia ovata]GBE58720.1 C6 zinc finger domain-containing protein, putative [Babesia ovata]